MAIRPLLRLLICAALMAAATWQFGWLSVPAVGVLWGAARRMGGGGAITAGLAAAAAWGGFLLLASTTSDVASIASMVGANAGVSAALALAGVVVLPALLAYSAALVGEGLSR